MGLWIGIAIFLFVLGSLMALKPSAKDMRLDRLRMTARKIGLEPKLVPCPDWIMGESGEKGKGMIAQYGLIIPDGEIIPCQYQIIDGKWRPYTERYHPNFTLDKMPVDFPPSITPNILGLSFKANFACIYWKENIGITGENKLETTENDLIQLKTQLHRLAVLVQNG